MIKNDLRTLLYCSGVGGSKPKLDKRLKYDNKLPESRPNRLIANFLYLLI